MISIDRALVLARIALAFGRVERVTFHEDGVRPETDTDHTVMLGLVACELAPAHLDRAKVAAFALVHDLAEVYAGDTQTLVISAEGMIAKRDREDAARARLATELGAGSWVAEILATYEEQQVPEARFVRAIDKVLPNLTHFFNGCAGARALTDRAGFIAARDRQYESLRRAYPELPDALDLLRASMVRAEECWPASEECREPCAPDLARDVLALADALRAAEARAVAAEAERDEARVNLATALAPNAADAALDDIAHACGCAQWEYPAQVARDVLAVVAARDAAVTGHAALAGAVRAEREATDALRFDAHHRSGFSRFDDGEEATEARATELRSATALDDARRATDALLAAAPAPTTVPAALVRAYLAAVEAFDGGALGAPCRASIRVDDTRAALVAALEK